MREFAAQSFCEALGFLLKNKEIISESDLRDLWLSKLRKNKDIFEDGWYMPPANGIGVIFATDKESGRLHHKSLRTMVARDDVVLDKEVGIAYVYCSPVERKTGIIGDFGMTFYLGKDSEIISHLIKCREINRQIFERLKVSMKFREIFDIATGIIENSGLRNDVLSVTSPDSVNVIGHTIPGVDEEFTVDEKRILQNAWNRACDMISKKRRFVGSDEHTAIKLPSAFTIEPRVKSDTKPMVSYHTIAAFHENGRKELLENFDDIFRLTGMNYMLGK